MLGRRIFGQQDSWEESVTVKTETKGKREQNSEEILMLLFEKFCYICLNDAIHLPDNTSKCSNAIKIIEVFFIFCFKSPIPKLNSRKTNIGWK